MLKTALLATATVLIATFTANAAENNAGEAEYMVACAVCHGESAKGNGPFASMMNTEVPGLTGLAAANEGKFPFLEVFQIVDGRTGVRGHGGPMPIWGDRFTAASQDLGPYSSEIVARGRIAVLVDYLQGIQD